jgi:hypothetical protein
MNEVDNLGLEINDPNDLSPEKMYYLAEALERAWSAPDSRSQPAWVEFGEAIKKLAGLAQKILSKENGAEVSRDWALAQFSWKPRFIQTLPDMVKAYSFLALTDKAGITSTSLGQFRFAHRAILYYCAACESLTSLPRQFWGPHYSKSAKNIGNAWRDVTMCRLWLASPEARSLMFQEIRWRNQDAAVSFAKKSPEIFMAKDREELAWSLLFHLNWSSERVKAVVVENIISFGAPAAVPAIKLLMQRETNTLGRLAAAQVLEVIGNTDHAVQMRELLLEEDLCGYEAEALRREGEMLRGALLTQEQIKSLELKEEWIKIGYLGLSLLGGYLKNNSKPDFGQSTTWQKTKTVYTDKTPSPKYHSDALARDVWSRNRLAKMPNLIAAAEERQAIYEPVLRSVVEGAIARLEKESSVG